LRVRLRACILRTGEGIPRPSSCNASLIKTLASMGEFESPTDHVQGGDSDGVEGDRPR
jgi:hypothetical protein